MGCTHGPRRLRRNKFHRSPDHTQQLRTGTKQVINKEQMKQQQPRRRGPSGSPEGRRAGREAAFLGLAVPGPRSPTPARTHLRKLSSNFFPGSLLCSLFNPVPLTPPPGRI